MNNIPRIFSKDNIIIFFIIIVFVAVFFVFYYEIIKNDKIKISKNNFNFVKQEFDNAYNECKEKKENWLFENECSKNPNNEIIFNYFNKSKKLINPYNNKEGVYGEPGSVQIEIHDKFLFIAIDVDANGGLDIHHKINF